MATTAFPTRDDFAAMLDESLGGADGGFEGRVVKGTVTAIENDLAVIDIGLKSEGRVPLREFAMPGQKADLNVGDEVEVYVDRVENANGETMLSRDRARREAAWDRLEEEFNKEARVEGEVKNATEFGLFVGLPGDVDGMVHMSDIAWGISGEEALHLHRKGEAVQVVVLDVDVEKERISLGIKQLEKGAPAVGGGVAAAGSLK